MTSLAAVLKDKPPDLLILSLALVPVSELRLRLGVATVLSSVKVMAAEAVLPAVSVSVTTTV